MAFRAIFAALIVFGCTVMTQACLIESLWPDVDCCCENGTPPRDQPDESCAQCVTLETGATPSTLDRLAVVVPVFVEDLARSVALQASLARVEAPHLWRMELPAVSRQVWQLVARTSVPVRGPSLA